MNKNLFGIVAAFLIGGIAGSLLLGGSVLRGKATPTPSTLPGAAAIALAERSIEANHLDAAADQLAEGLREIEEKGPLRIRNLTLVDKNVNGYGLYTPIAGATIKPGDTIVLYFEPSGFVHKQENGRFVTSMSADFELLNEAGATIGGQKDFLKSDLSSLRPNRELQFNMQLPTSGVPTKEEIRLSARVTLHDKLGNKTAVDTIPVTIRP